MNGVFASYPDPYDASSDRLDGTRTRQYHRGCICGAGTGDGRGQGCLDNHDWLPFGGGTACGTGDWNALGRANGGRETS